MNRVILSLVFLALASSVGLAADTYEIQAAGNDEIFVINDEKFVAKTYCMGWDVGNHVIFVEGSPLGACASAKLYNVDKEEICEVWCE